MHKPKRHIFVCGRYRDPASGKPSCAANNSTAIYEAFRRELEGRLLWDTIQLTGTQCLGYCDQGPIAVVYPEGVWYTHLTEDDVPKILEEHLIGGKPYTKKVME